MARRKIDDLWLRNVTPPPRKDEGGTGRQDDHWDEVLTGFGVRVAPRHDDGTVRKTFVVRYRANGRRRCYVLGTYDSKTFGVAKARDAARDVLARVRLGEDPAAERQRARTLKPVTLREFLDEYIEKYSKPHKRTWRDDARRLGYAKARLGSVPLSDLTPSAVARLHSEIAKRAPVEANRIVEVLRAALTKAREWGHLPDDAPNVAGRVKRLPEAERERFLTKTELPRVLQAINAERREYVRAALSLILMTGLRKMEALRLQWEYVDFDTRHLRIPETKTGKGRTVPLTDGAARLLESIPRREGSPFVFPGRYKGTHLGESLLDRSWRRIRKAAGVEDVTIHDLRRTAGSHLAMQGVSLQVIGMILGHDSLRATKIYARFQPGSGLEAQALSRYNAMLSDLAGKDEEEARRA